MNVVLIFRSKLLKYYSIENVFGAVLQEMPAKIEIESLYVNKPGFRLSNLIFLRRFVKRRSRDTIYHVTGDIHYVVFAFPRKNCLLTIHDCVFINKRKGLKRWILKKLFLDWPVWYVPLITVISGKTKDEIISLTGCNPDKIRIINNPVSAGIRFSHKSFNISKPVLLFIGTTPNKNLDRVIEALRGLSCTMDIIGEPGDTQILKLKEYNIHYVLEKDLTNEEMANRYDMADVVLFPSLYEGFGLPVIEGFKAGKPVLTSGISPMKEISGEAAWLVDPYSPESIRSTLDMIINDQITRESKVELGISLAEEYTSEKIASQYHRVYKELYKQNTIK